MLDLLPEWLRDGLGDEFAFWFGYFTNGAHRSWYASVQFTLFAAFGGALVALSLGLAAAAAHNRGPLPVRIVAAGYINIVRGIPDVLFFLFFPIAFEQGIEWIWAQSVCPPEAFDGSVAHWPPCPEANWRLSTGEYLVMATVSLGIVYGAFAANVLSGALRAIPNGQVEAARAFGLSRWQIFWRIEIRQMWAFAMPGLSNVWQLLIKSTALLSLLQIIDIVAWAQRLGSANYSRVAGLVHPDWRWQYYAALLVFYLLLTYGSEKIFAALTRRARRGMPVAAGDAA